MLTHFACHRPSGGVSTPVTKPETERMKLKTKIVIAEDQTLVREGLKALLDGDGRYEVVGEAADGVEAIRAVGRHTPDLLLLDLSMPKMSGISAISEIKRQNPDTRILVITFHTADEYILEVFKAGAEGYCLKNATHEELLLAVESVMAGKRYISPEVSEKVLEGYIEGRRTIKTESAWDTLTPREKEVLKLVGEGHTSPEIGEILCISPKTVDKHRANIMNKLELHSAPELTAYAIRKGLVVKS